MASGCAFENWLVNQEMSMISAKYFLKLCNLLAQQRTESCCKKILFFSIKKILRYWWRAYLISVVSLEACLFFFWQNFPGSSVRNLLKVRCKAICFFFTTAGVQLIDFDAVWWLKRVFGKSNKFKAWILTSVDCVILSWRKEGVVFLFLGSSQRNHFKVPDLHQAKAKYHLLYKRYEIFNLWNIY